MGEAEAQDDEPAEQAHRVEQREQVADELHVPVDRQPAHDVRQRHADEERRDDRTADDAPCPNAGARCRRRACRRYSKPMFRTMRATSRHEQRQVQGREHRRVPLGEGGEGRAARGEQPDLVAVPVRADRREHDAPALLGVDGIRAGPEHGEQGADPEVEPLEHEVCRPEQADEAEPDECVVHVVSSAVSRRTRAGQSSSEGRAFGRFLEGVGAAPDVGEEELDLDDGEHGVHRGVGDHRDPDLGRAHRGGDAGGRRHEPVDDPRLAAGLGEDPAPAVREHRCEGRDDGDPGPPASLRRGPLAHRPQGPRAETHREQAQADHEAERPVRQRDDRRVAHRP